MRHVHSVVDRFKLVYLQCQSRHQSGRLCAAPQRLVLSVYRVKFSCKIWYTSPAMTAFCFQLGAEISFFKHVRFFVCVYNIYGAHRLQHVNDDNDRASLLKHSYKFHFHVLSAQPDVTECFMVIFVEQPNKILLDWCEKKLINYLNAKININRIFSSYNCD